MIVRPAGPSDLPVLRRLRGELEAELGGSSLAVEGGGGGDREALSGERVAVIAEEDGQPAGYAELRLSDPELAWLEGLYVRPASRGRGLGRRLLAEAVALLRARASTGSLAVELPAAHDRARSFAERLGFSAYALRLAVPLDRLERELAPTARPASFGRVFVQTDDAGVVERTVRAYLPRLGRSRRTLVGPPRAGWVAVEDELCSREPGLLRRLAQELSYRAAGVVLALGIEEGQVVRYVLFDRGSLADEYASLPEHYGPLPPGDVVALAANPRVAQRLTGADPARLRAVARTARRPEDLPPPEKLYAELADVLGVSAAGSGLGSALGESERGGPDPSGAAPG